MPEPIRNEQDPTASRAAWASITEAKRKLRERINQGQYGKVGQRQATVLDDARSLVALIDATKAEIAPEELDWSSAANSQAEADYLSACCWAAEGLEYFGRTKEVRAIVEREGERLLALLERRPACYSAVPSTASLFPLLPVSETSLRASPRPDFPVRNRDCRKAASQRLAVLSDANQNCLHARCCAAAIG
jgi:hypothetical protein